MIADRVGIPAAWRNLFNFSVSDYYFNGVWNMEVAFLMEYPDIVDDISRHRCTEGSKDIRIWEKSLHGTLSSNLAYYILSPHFPEVNWGSWIWQSFIPKCRSSTIWKVVHNLESGSQWSLYYSPIKSEKKLASYPPF